MEDDNQVPSKIAEIAAGYKDANTAVLVFVRTLKAVSAIEKELTKTDRKIVLLTGTMRGKERDELVQKDEFKRFLKGAEPGETVYLICTSAGEVGVDMSANHKVCDLSTFDSMAQRLGRVHRYGEPIEHVAHIDVVHPSSFGKIDKKTGELKADEIDKRRQKTLELLKMLPAVGDNEYDASPKALADLRQRSDLPFEIEQAFAPEPMIVPATDILFDAWALTSVKGKMPGRPDVAPYLHGIADDLPQTTIAWRAELDLLKHDPDPTKKLKAIFKKHRIRPHESLTANSCRVVEFLKEITAPKVRPELLETRVVLIFARYLELTTIKELIDDSGPLNADPTLVLPASFGGLNDKGMLSIPDPTKKKTKADVKEDEENETAPARPPTFDIADIQGYEPYKDAKRRLRTLIKRSGDTWSAHAMPGEIALPAGWGLEDSDGTSTRLVNQISTRSGLNVRLVQAVEFDEEGDPICSLVCLSPPPQQGQAAEKQYLDAHVRAVVEAADRIARSLKLEEPYRSALLFAAKWHDEGKKAIHWQRYIGRDPEGPELGKSAKWRDPKLLAGYRHEFGSLLRIPDEEARRYFADPKLNLTAEQQEQAYDLALHMIASHHGYSRPHFANSFDIELPNACEAVHVKSIQRFARLQRKYGRWGLAYLESLLRAADAAASRKVGFDPETDDDEDSDTDGADA